jgi:hypothetical protein
VITVFVLMIFTGLGDEEKLYSDKMIFRSLIDCQWYAARMVRVYGNYGYTRPGTEKITAYCLPVEMAEDTEERLY